MYLVSFLSIILLSVFHIRVAIIYYFSFFAYYALLLVFVPHYAPFFPVLKVKYIGLVYTFCAFLYFLWAADNSDDPDYNAIDYNATDFFLYNYWLLRYGRFYQWDISEDKVTRFYKGVRFNRHTYAMFVAFSTLWFNDCFK